MNLEQHQKEVLEKYDEWYNKDTGRLVDFLATITALTWEAAQEEMREEIRVFSYKEKAAAQQY